MSRPPRGTEATGQAVLSAVDSPYDPRSGLVVRWMSAERKRTQKTPFHVQQICIVPCCAEKKNIRGEISAFCQPQITKTRIGEDPRWAELNGIGLPWWVSVVYWSTMLGMRRSPKKARKDPERPLNPDQCGTNGIECCRGNREQPASQVGGKYQTATSLRLDSQFRRSRMRIMSFC
jgi:hypothetical protein